ncbi:MAG: hypothetical protein EBS49_07830 [Verrucomicrobia bacterium]|nr:hypothetical protein [Verrucomicrobiota bacterium]
MIYDIRVMFYIMSTIDVVKFKVCLKGRALFWVNYNINMIWHFTYISITIFICTDLVYGKQVHIAYIRKLTFLQRRIIIWAYFQDKSRFWYHRYKIISS